ncbi:MAG: DUF1016 N-terminal domain-containing protein [Candidatus Omnitrophota bacterium]
MLIIQINHETDSDDTLMTSKPPKTITIPASVYQPLLKQVKKTLLEGQARIEAERVRTYWETGNIIQTHIKQSKSRADYGAQVIKRLADDLGLNSRLLERCVQFSRTYSRAPIATARSQFTWTHYRELMAVSDPDERGRLEERAARHQWSTDELLSQIRAGKDKPQKVDVKKELPPVQTPLIPARGTLYTYQITKRPAVASAAEPELMIDVGFSNFHKVEDKLLSKFSGGQIIESRGADGDYKFYTGARTPKDLFTYQAYVERVIDGDTLKVRVDQGFNMWTRQTLRLRGIDCPEMDTKEGAAAKTFVQSLIKEADRVIIRTNKSDKYDRYLADIFIPQGESPDAGTDVYLNNLLLEKGYAERV